MSRRNRGQSSSGQTFNQIPSNVLTRAYELSLQQNPQFHHQQATTDPKMREKDFLSWVSGVRSCLNDTNILQYAKGYTGTTTQSNLPTNIQEAMSSIQRGSKVRRIA